MKWVYAALCVLGTALPYYFLTPFLLDEGLNIRLMVSQLLSSRVSSFFAADVIVSSLVLFAFIYHETRKRPVRFWWLAIAGALTVGVSLGLPLFLLLRELEAEA